MFKKRVITSLVALALFATSVTPAFAEDTQNGSADGTTNPTATATANIGTTNQANPSGTLETNTGTLVNPTNFNKDNQKLKPFKQDMKNNKEKFEKQEDEKGFEKEKSFENEGMGTKNFEDGEGFVKEGNFGNGMGMKNFEDDQDFEDEMEDQKIDLVCMQTAVEKKENAEIAATDTLNTSVKAAMAVRRDALKAAWGIEDRKIRDEATRKAWKEFRRTMRSIQKVMKKTMRTVARQFEDDSYNCGVEGEDGNGNGNGNMM